MAAPVLQFKRGLLTNLPGLRAGEPGFTTDSYDLYVGIDSSSGNNKFFGSHRYWKKETTSTGSGVNLVEGTSNGSQYLTLKAPDTLSGIATYVFPDTTDGTSGDFLKLNSTTGNIYSLEWASIPSGTFTIAGDTGTDSFSTGETLTFAGTANEIETTVTDNQVQIGLPNNVSISGILTASSGAVLDSVQVGINTAVIETTSGKLTLTSATGVVEVTNRLDVLGDIDVSGNVYIGGTTITLRGEDVYIQNKDIVLGYTTTTEPNDTSANHAGVAIASTEGTPLASFFASGINTLPDTYKQMMWFKSGTLGFNTDAFAFNYGVAIGTTTMADGVRLAVGSGITMSDTEISATNFYGALSGNSSSSDQVKTVTASDTNATYYVTFVDANNGSATNESVYTDDGIYYNPGTNTFTTQNALFTNNVEVQGTITGTATTATRATTVDTTATSTNATYYVPFVDTLAGQNGETIRVGVGLSLNPSDGSVATRGILSVGNAADLTSYIKAGGGSNALYMYANGDVSFQAKAIASQIRSNDNATTLITLSGLNATFAQDIQVTGITTTGTLKLNGTPGIGITGISASTTLAENSDDYLPTQKAVKAYVDAVDVTLGLNADSGGPSTVSTSQTLTINGTASEVETSVSGQTITVGLPDAVVVGTSLSAPTIRTGTIQSSNTGATAITIAANDVTIADDLTVGGNLYVNGSTTQVNTASITVEDRTIELGVVDGSAPSSTTTWDLGVLFNYYDGSAKKSALVWEQTSSRFKLGSVISDGGGTGNDNPQITFTTYAALEVGDLWINNSCTGGSSQVIGCVGSELQLQNITIDAGTF